jgi:hypothetical protein
MRACVGAQAVDEAVRRTLRPDNHADPGLSSVMGLNWFGPSGDGGFEDVIHTFC